MVAVVAAGPAAAAVVRRWSNGTKNEKMAKKMVQKHYEMVVYQVVVLLAEQDFEWLLERSMARRICRTK